MSAPLILTVNLSRRDGQVHVIDGVSGARAHATTLRLAMGLLADGMERRYHELSGLTARYPHDQRAYERLDQFFGEPRD